MRILLTTAIICLSLVACGMPTQEDTLATQVATALIATSAAQGAIDTAVAATMTSNQSQEAPTATPGDNTAPILITATTVPATAVNQSNPSPTTQVAAPPATATASPEAVVASETPPPSETVIVPPTDTAVILPTETILVEPSITATPRLVLTLVLQPTSTISLVIPTLKPLTPIILPTIRLP